jgi:predicted enzyme related to lactoylglutathione lyase
MRTVNHDSHLWKGYFKIFEMTIRSMVYSQVYLAIASNNLDGLVEFYGALLGQPADAWVPSRYGEFHLPGLKLAFFCPRQDHRERFQNISEGAMSICLEVADLEAAIAHLQTLGQSSTSPIITASHGREIYAQDPDGNRLILHQAVQ